MIKIDFDEILKYSKTYLENGGIFPRNCPKPDCLSIGSVRIDPRSNRTTISIDASPPQLPTTREGRLYERHPICDENCGILGNLNRQFFVRGDNTTGEIIEAAAAWRPSY